MCQLLGAMGEPNPAQVFQSIQARLHAMPCHAMPCHAMPCRAMPFHAMPCHAMPQYSIGKARDGIARHGRHNPSPPNALHCRETWRPWPRHCHPLAPTAVGNGACCRWHYRSMLMAIDSNEELASIARTSKAFSRVQDKTRCGLRTRRENLASQGIYPQKNRPMWMAWRNVKGTWGQFEFPDNIHEWTGEMRTPPGDRGTRNSSSCPRDRGAPSCYALLLPLGASVPRRTRRSASCRPQAIAARLVQFFSCSPCHGESDVRHAGKRALTRKNMFLPILHSLYAFWRPRRRTPPCGYPP